MNWPDYALLAIIAASMLVGVFRGLIKEAMSLVVWAAAFWAAFNFSGGVAELIPGNIDLPSARTAIAFGGVFLLVLLVGGLVTYLIGQLVEKTGLSGTDRLLGLIFGAARGLLIITLIIMVAQFTPIPRDPWWRESTILPRFDALVDWAADFLPDNVREMYDKQRLENETYIKELEEEDAQKASEQAGETKRVRMETPKIVVQNVFDHPTRGQT